MTGSEVIFATLDGCNVELHVIRGPDGRWVCHELRMAGPITSEVVAKLAPARRIREWAEQRVKVPESAPNTPEGAAAVYAAALAANLPPRQAVMRALGIPRSTANYRMREARARGLA